MHILHVDLGREMRGGQHQVILLLQELQQAGHSFTLLANRYGALLQVARQLGFPAEPADLVKLRRFSHDSDLVHVHDAKSHTWAALAVRQPFVVSRRVAFRVQRSAVSAWKYHRAARFLAVSKFVSKVLMDSGIDSSIIDVIYDAIKVTGPATWNASGAVVALASNDPAKGRDVVELAARQARIPIAFSANLEKDLHGASAFIYISRSEGLGSAALLAMSRGIPVIASRMDGMLELFENDISGVYVDNDAGAIARALERLRANCDLAQKIGMNARTRVESCFNPASLSLKTLASYRRVLDH